MKKSDLLQGIFLIILLAGGIAGIGLGIREQEEAGILSHGYTLSPPVLSEGSGFYDEPFTLSITASDNANIYYTLDGSTPTRDSLWYEEPFLVSYGTGDTYIQNMQENWLNGEGESHANLATVLRAAVIDESGASSDVVTATYFIGQDNYKNHTVVSLIADPDDLFGDNGIYVTGKKYDDWYLGDQDGNMPVPNFLQSGKAWEKPAVMEIFQMESILCQPVGIRIQGASMRSGENKRFSVYARKEYSGSNWFQTPLFGDWRTHSLVLRSGFMNGYIQHLVQDRDVASAESREVIVYLNGALWYITIAQEKYSGKYFQEKYGIDDDNVIIIKHQTADSRKAEDQQLFQEITTFLETHDLADPEAYQEFNRIMDIQSYIDYSCVNIYFANMDYNDTKNIIYWRARRPGSGEYEDGRWRLAFYDLDLENLNYGVSTKELNAFTMETHYAGGPFNTRPLWTALKRNDLFRQQFTVSFMDIINTDFTVERATEAMDGWEITLPWWGMQQEWMADFFPARTKAVIGHLSEELELTGTPETLTLSVNDPEGGSIILNTIVPDLSEGSWSGLYYTDYPVEITVRPNDGYAFAGWQGEGFSDNGSSAAITVQIPPGGLALQAVFQKK